MNIVYLELKPIDDSPSERLRQRFVELRYRVPDRLQYESRTLPLVNIAGLYDFADTDFARNSPNLAQIGRQLFDWLDGDERWLSRSIQQYRQSLILAILVPRSFANDCQDRLGGLPWEVLYYEGFLVARSITSGRLRQRADSDCGWITASTCKQRTVEISVANVIYGNRSDRCYAQIGV